MKSGRKNSGVDRRGFLATTGASLLAAAVPASSNAGVTYAASISGGPADPFGAPVQGAVPGKAKAVGSLRRIPIGVFDPVYDKLSLDEMLDTMNSLGLEAVEIGTGNYPNNPHCPINDLLEDKAKAKAWKKKFEDKGIQVATLSCHGNPVHPDAAHAAKDAETFKKTVRLAEMLDVRVIVGFSGTPGGTPQDTQPNWITYRWPPEYGQMLDWQWKEKLIPYWKEAAKFARSHGVKRLAFEMHPKARRFTP
jgi:sugar phosphate isomerase/epimerase